MSCRTLLTQRLFETSVMTKSFTYTLDHPSHTQARFPTRSGSSRRFRRWICTTTSSKVRDSGQNMKTRMLSRGCPSDHVIDALFVILCLKSSQTDSRRPTYSSLRTQAQCRSRSGTLRPSRSWTCRTTLFQVSWRTLLRGCPSYHLMYIIFVILW